MFENKYAIPDGVSVVPDSSCEYLASSSVSTSVHQYQDTLRASLSGHVSGNVGFAKLAFTASAGFHYFVDNTVLQHSSQVSATARCVAYSASLKEIDWQPTFTQEFSTAVRGLGTSVPLSEFVRVFGTHYVAGMQLGGTSTYTASIDAGSLHNLRQLGVDVSAAASLSCLPLSVGTSARVATSQLTRRCRRRSRRRSSLGFPSRRRRAMAAPATGPLGLQQWRQTLNLSTCALSASLMS